MIKTKTKKTQKKNKYIFYYYEILLNYMQKEYSMIFCSYIKSNKQNNKKK